MAYEIPIYIYPVHERFLGSLIYEDVKIPVEFTPEKDQGTD